MLVLAMAFELLHSETFLQFRPPRSPIVYPNGHWLRLVVHYLQAR